MTLHTLIDYDMLRLIWWVLLGVLLIGFSIMDGFDLGVGMLLPFVAKTDTERRITINTIGPVWEGNQVWLILGGGAIFAAWPPLYAVSFSGFYLAMFAILFALILRPVGFKYRSKRESMRWRNNWDWALFVGGFVPSLIFGVAVGNVLQGVPFRFDDSMRIFYDGTFLGLLNPYALLCGLLSLAMFAMHGASWLLLKASGEIVERARTYGSIAALLVIVLFAAGGFFLWIGVDGYAITSDINPAGPSNPLMKTVTMQADAWLANYQAHSWLYLTPVLGFAGAVIALIGMRGRMPALTFLASAVSIFGVISTVGVSMFPFILPSSADPKSSLTVWDASSSHQTLFIMLAVAVIFLPIIFIYTGWVYRILWGRVDEASINDKGGHAY